MLKIPGSYMVLSQVIGDDNVHGIRWTTARGFKRSHLEDAKTRFFNHCDEFPDGCKEGSVANKMRHGSHYKNLIACAADE